MGKIKHQNAKMKLFATIIAIATASTAISYDTKIGCTCCLGSISCCAACCISHCTADADVQAKVTESLEVIQADLNEIQTEACGKCALCYMNGDYCSECTRGDAGCPIDAYNQMETALSALKE